MAKTGKLTYSIVIATRNRPGALRLSLPRMLNQSVPPEQLIVVDASDDHAEVVQAVKSSLSGFRGDVQIIECEKGSARQRNCGLELVISPVVFFPDDDAIWFPNVAASVMEAYQGDSAKRIVGVCPFESSSAPAGFNEQKEEAYRMTFEDRLRQRLVRFRASIEDVIVPDPFKLIAHTRAKEHHVVIGQGDSQCPVEYMTGFRMTFRTETIRAFGFDESLKGYSLNEDIDASLAAWQEGVLIGVPAARVFHFKSPERRAGGFELGAKTILNKAYVVAKHTQPDDRIRRKAIRWLKYKVFLYSIARKGGEFNARRADGAKASLMQAYRVLRAQPLDAPKVFCEAKQ